MAKLEQVVKGIKSDQAKHGKQQSPRVPITSDLLLRIKGVWEREPPGRDKAMLWAAASLCFFGFYAQEKYASQQKRPLTKEPTYQ